MRGGGGFVSHGADCLSGPLQLARAVIVTGGKGAAVAPLVKRGLRGPGNGKCGGHL